MYVHDRIVWGGWNAMLLENILEECPKELVGERLENALNRGGRGFEPLLRCIISIFWPGGGRGTPGCFPMSICSLFIHIVTPFGWRHVYVGGCMGKRSKSIWIENDLVAVCVAKMTCFQCEDRLAWFLCG